MQQRLKIITQLLTYNLKPLVAFEALYRFAGVLIIGPLLYWLFMLSIRLSGYTYITNRALLGYAFQPTTLLIGLIALFVITLYIALEMVVLMACFKASHRRQKLTLTTLLFASLGQLKRLIKKRRFGVVVLTFLFFYAVQAMHVVGVARTFQLPAVVRERLFEMTWFLPLVVFVSVVLVVVFFATVFALPTMILDGQSLAAALKKSSKQRAIRFGSMVLEGLVINVVLNCVLYAVYATLILIAGGGVYLADTTVVIGRVLLSVIYTVYVVFGIVASVGIIPINAAWVFSTLSSQPSETILIGSQHHTPMKPLRRTLLAMLVLVVVLVNALTVNAAISAPRGPIEVLSNPLVIAHRGSSLRAPENTLSAIDLALEERADAVEFDIRVTEDGVAVLMHDFTIGRTTDTDIDHLVSDVSFDALRTMDAGGWFSEYYANETVPTLREALKMIEGEAVAHVELKVSNPQLEAELVAMLVELDMVDDAVVYAFNPEVLRRVKAQNEAIETLLLLATFYGHISVLLDYDFVDGFGVSYGVLTSRSDALQGLREAGKYVYVWTINDRTRMERALDIGVDGIISDDPVLVHEVITTYEPPSRLPPLLERLFGQ